MRYRYFDPFEQSVVEGEVATGAEVAPLVGRVTGSRGRRAPALEFAPGDGASMLLGVDLDRAVVLWTTADGLTRHTIGAPSDELTAMFDFFGSCTQMPGHYAVPLATAVGAAGDFVDRYPVAGAGPALPFAMD